MKIQRDHPSFTVTKKCEKYIKEGNLWVYGDEILSETGGHENGQLCDVFSEKGTYLGTGFASDESKIRVRILSSNANDVFDERFWERRVKYALDYRRTVMKDDFRCCRLIFGEADGFPGLTVDRFSGILVTQVLSYGMERVKDTVYRKLIDVLGSYGEEISGIYERNDSQIRLLEGLEQTKGWYAGYSHPEKTETEITENGIKYLVDFENGQKTGFFLDQKYNRAAVSRLSEGRNVLDCFTHTGSFALNALKGGAKSVTAVDVSETAVNQAKKNAELNGGAGEIDFAVSDAFDYLGALLEKGGHPFDLIILDPPAFTKSRRTVGNAQRGYAEINTAAMRLLPRGGYLATCSCSHFMPAPMFEKMLVESAKKTGVTVRQIEARQQSPDHPILLGSSETDYLKFYILQIV